MLDEDFIFLILIDKFPNVLYIFQIRPEAAYLYDAVWLYAKAVNECISNEQDYRNGMLIISKIKHKTYQSKFFPISIYFDLHEAVWQVLLLKTLSLY